MKKRNSKKGFTLVELVIVIAVIAILASVLIPTFGNIITKANESAAFQQAANEYREAAALAWADGKITENETVETSGGFTFKFTTENSTADASVVTYPSGYTYDVTITGGKVSVKLK